MNSRANGSMASKPTPNKTKPTAIHVLLAVALHYECGMVMSVAV
jgi:hypothetical protein